MLILKLVLILIWTLVGAFLFSKLIFGKDAAEWLVEQWKALTVKKVVAKPVVKAKPVVQPKPVEVIKPQPKPVEVVKPTPKPVVKEEKEEEEEDAMANVQIFKKKIKARATFYESLTDAQKAEFRSYFVDEGKDKLVKELTYTLKGNNDAFFERVFNYIFAFRKVISLGLLTKLTEELLSLSEGDADVQTILFEAAIRVAYARRKAVQFLDQAEAWSKEDVTLHQTKLNTKGKIVYSFTRLAIILEKKGQFKEALALVEESKSRNLKEKTKTGLEGRKARLLKKLAKKA
jgi:hypothetical protein